MQTEPQAAQPRGDYRILSIDGGGIRGVFPAALLAWVEEHVGNPIASYFDLIAGTSTGGIIAIGLGLGIPAAEILRLYEEKGPLIFDQHRGLLSNWARQKVRGARQLFAAKYTSDELRNALQGVLQDRRLGERAGPAWSSRRGTQKLSGCTSTRPRTMNAWRTIIGGQRWMPRWRPRPHLPSSSPT